MYRLESMYHCIYHISPFYIIGQVPVSFFRHLTKIQKGSARPHTEKVGKITRAQAEEIAKTKAPDLTAADMDAAVRTIAGSARSMGIVVEGL